MDMPYTICFVIRKRQQIDNLNELPKSKRPPNKLIWEGSPEELESWIDRVFFKNEQTESSIIIDSVEGN